MTQTKKRFAQIERTTKETQIKIEFYLDGEGKAEIDTGVPFMDHMLDLFMKHGLFDGKIVANGDTILMIIIQQKISESF